MTLLSAGDVRVVGYEGTAPADRTPARHSPVLFHDGKHYRVDHWRGGQVEAAEIVVDENVTRLPDEWAAIPNGYFVVLGDRERAALAHLRAVLTNHAPHIEVPDFESRLDLYLPSADAESLWTAVRLVARRELVEAAVRADELAELAWWLYGASMTGEEVALACRALEESGETEARRIARDGFRRLRIPAAEHQALWEAANLPRPPGGKALTRSRAALRRPALLRRTAA
jgi:hypothetical protein